MKIEITYDNCVCIAQHGQGRGGRVMATGICPFCGKTVDKFIMFRGDVVGCRYCGIHTKKTNADRIRAMTDEGIEAWYWWMHKEMMYYTDSVEFVHDWLKREVKEDR